MISPPFPRRLAFSRRLRRGLFAAGSGIHAFTLIELLTVMAIMVIMMLLAAPAFNSISSGRDFKTAVTGIASALEQARAYAMANNTYVFVGIGEFDSSLPDSAAQTEVLAPAVGGRVAIAAVASRTGVRPYDNTSAQTSWSNGYANGALLISVGNVQRYENLNIASLGVPPSSGAMARPVVTPSGDDCQIGDATCVSVTPFTYPLGSVAGAGRYTFTKVINFDPQGVARIQYNDNTNAISDYIEVDLLPAHGKGLASVLAGSNSGNQAAIQIDCISGATRIYMP